jgi:hypothetical protein
LFVHAIGIVVGEFYASFFFIVLCYPIVVLHCGSLALLYLVLESWPWISVMILLSRSQISDVVVLRHFFYHVGTKALTEIRGHQSGDSTFFRSNWIGLSIVGPGSVVPNLWHQTQTCRFRSDVIPDPGSTDSKVYNLCVSLPDHLPDLSTGRPVRLFFWSPGFPSKVREISPGSPGNYSITGPWTRTFKTTGTIAFLPLQKIKIDPT